MRNSVPKNYIYKNISGNEGIYKNKLRIYKKSVKICNN